LTACSGLEPVRRLLGGERRTGDLGSRRFHLDFLGAPRFRSKTGLDFLWKFLGFPWILSSETSLINGLYGIPARKLFSQRLSRRCESARWERTMGARGGGCGSAGLFMGMSLPMFPLFRNQMLRSRVAFASVQRQAAPGERLR